MAILVELDERSWQLQIDRFAAWLGNVQLAQSAFRQHLEKTVLKVQEPHIRIALSELAEYAREHERQVADLYRAIGREPSPVRQVAGELMAKAGEVAANVQGSLGGAHGPWRDLHGLVLANVNALGAFGIAETLGLALGLPEIVEIIVPIMHQKQTAQLLLKEYMLEMAAVAILYQLPT